MKVLNDIQYELNEIAGISEIIDVDDNGGVDIPRGDDAIETFIKFILRPARYG